VIRLSDEAMLVELADSIRLYYKRIGDDKAAASVSLMIVEHLYYKHDSMAVAVQRAHMFSKSWGKYSDLHPGCKGKEASVADRTARKSDKTHPAAWSGNPSVSSDSVSAFNAAAVVEELSHYIFKHGDERSKTRALLCSVFHHALHDRYYRARDMFLISHIQDVIDKADTKTQILYNRALVVLGLSAFRQGLIAKAHDCLAGICTGRVRELLAQGQARWHDRDPDQEKVERRRQMPYHMHINPDLLECCHLTCAMLLELPHMARGATSTHTHAISRQFRKYLQTYNRQDFTGPPENTREHVLAAAKALMSGEWQRACDYILGLEVWNLIPGDGGVKVKEMLRMRIKEEAVRTYLITYGAHYESISVEHICKMFDLEEMPARRTISRMLFNKEISGAWEQHTGTLVLNNVDPSPMQALAQQVAEKVAMLVDSNERVLDPLVNPSNYREEWGARGGDRGDQRKWEDNGRGGRGGRSKFGSSKPQHARVFTQEGNRNRGNRVGGRGNRGWQEGGGGRGGGGDGGGRGGGGSKSSSSGSAGDGGYRKEGAPRKSGWGATN